MRKRYYKNLNAEVYYQFTDRPAFQYDILVIRKQGSQLIEQSYLYESEETCNNIMRASNLIDKAEFYALQDQLILGYKGLSRVEAKIFFKHEWEKLFSLRKQARIEATKALEANPNQDYISLLEHQYQYLGISDQRGVLVDIDEEIRDSLSMIDIYQEARAEASIDYCKANGAVIIN